MSSATNQWFRPQMPHMPVRLDECAIVMMMRGILLTPCNGLPLGKT